MRCTARRCSPGGICISPGFRLNSPSHPSGLAAGGWEIEVVRVLETDLALVVRAAALRADEPAEVS